MNQAEKMAIQAKKSKKDLINNFTASCRSLIDHYINFEVENGSTQAVVDLPIYLTSLSNDMWKLSKKDLDQINIDLNDYYFDLGYDNIFINITYERVYVNLTWYVSWYND